MNIDKVDINPQSMLKLTHISSLLSEEGSKELIGEYLYYGIL